MVVTVTQGGGRPCLHHNLGLTHQLPECDFAVAVWNLALDLAAETAAKIAAGREADTGANASACSLNGLERVLR